MCGEVLLNDHSNERYSVVLSSGASRFVKFYSVKILDSVCFGRESVN